ncbi:MAG TPA: polysaccharide deacetylase family protein [Candidatus Binataceae bacterium]|nr:polysaccharide deacetylase family protein [Candidatus Binataceae bacterium]
MAESSQSQVDLSTAERLGYRADARLLMINADDFGMCHDQNEGVIRGLTEGVFTSSTILVTCPWFEEAAAFGRSNPGADLGVHLTLTSEWENYKWGPVLGPKAVPSLVDARGYLWRDVPEVFANDRLDEAEAELRAQIEKALAAGIDVTHIDCHMGPLQLRADYHELYWRLARDYRLPLRITPRVMMRQMEFGAILSGLDRDGILYPDGFHVGGAPNPETTDGYWTQVIRGLPPGISEIYCHPAVAREELMSCTRDGRQREADLRFFTSDKARRLLAENGIQRIGYRELRDAMRNGTARA